MNEDHYQIEVHEPTGMTTSCQVTVAESGDDYVVSLAYSNVLLNALASDIFEAFVEIRTSLLEKGAIALCYASSKNVFPSAMSRGMGGGVNAYRLTMGKQARREDLVCIFDSGPDVEPVPPEVQKEFFKSWLDSLSPNAG